MFIKVVDNSAWDFPEPKSELIKLASNGLTGEDRRAFIKRAGASLLDKVDSMDFKPGEVPVHIIAVGATEFYGPNRNGDGFSKKACEDYHHYFVKDARFYRNHKNTDKSKSYGIVKASAYNKKMNRIELIVALNGTEKAAKANGGLVADKELDNLERGKDTPTSMACSSDPLFPILTESGYRPIKDIKVGDIVYTKERRYRKVIELNRRNFTGYIYTINLLNTRMDLTEGHLLWVKRGDNDPCWMPVENILLTDTLPSGEHKDEFFEITSISREYLKEIPVYNFEVEEDHSYVAAGIISHNCRVPYDVCSYCGNKAVTRADYCDDVENGGHCKAGGLKHNMCKTANVDGKIVRLYADNTKPMFFDISNVVIPADRIAYVTGRVKTASAEVISGAELAELYGLYESGSQKMANYQPMDTGYYETLRCLTDAVSDFHTGEMWKKQAGYANVVDKEPMRFVKTANAYPYPMVVAALNQARHCMTPTQFLEITMNAPTEKVASIAEIIAPLSNEKFAEFIVDGDHSNPYISRTGRVPEQLANWANMQKCATWRHNAFVKQAALNTLTEEHRHFTPQYIYSMQGNSDVDTLCRDYAMYKVAFIHSLPKEEQQEMASYLVARDYMSF